MRQKTLARSREKFTRAICALGFLRDFGALRRVDANFRQVGKQISRPAVNIVFAHVHTHVVHARRLLLFGHIQRAVNGLGQLLNVVRIDE